MLELPDQLLSLRVEVRRRMQTAAREVDVVHKQKRGRGQRMGGETLRVLMAAAEDILELFHLTLSEMEDTLLHQRALLDTLHGAQQVTVGTDAEPTNDSQPCPEPTSDGQAPSESTNDGQAPSEPTNDSQPCPELTNDDQPPPEPTNDGQPPPEPTNDGQPLPEPTNGLQPCPEEPVSDEYQVMSSDQVDDEEDHGDDEDLVVGGGESEEEEGQNPETEENEQEENSQQAPFHPCLVCFQSFGSAEVLLRHVMRRCNSDETQLRCGFCGELSSSHEDLKSHYETHREHCNLCSTCGKSFRHSRDLKKHTLIHTGEKPFSCEQCGREFTWRDSLKAHMKTHQARKPYECKLRATFDSTATIQPGNRGGKVLVHEGYRYTKNKVQKEKIHWRCWRQKACGAYLQTPVFDMDKEVANIAVIQVAQHDHPSDADLIETSALKRRMVEAVEADPSSKIKKVYDQVILGAQVRAHVPEFKTVSSILNRRRASRRGSSLPTASLQPGNRGGRVLVHEGYRYTKNKVQKDKIHWRCWRKLCGAYLQTAVFDAVEEGADVTVIRVAKHNHPKDEALIETSALKRSMVEAVDADPSSPLKKVYERVVVGVGDARQDVPQYKSVRSLLNRRRASLKLPSLHGAHPK